MGLDTTHDCWHGPYSTFNSWRQAIAIAAGMPPLCFMEGFFDQGDYRDPIADYARKFEASAAPIYAALPIRWEVLQPDAIHPLLSHSDCDGEIDCHNCGPMADRLEELLPSLTVDWQVKKTRQFIDGLRCAVEAGEDVEFH